MKNTRIVVSISKLKIIGSICIFIFLNGSLLAQTIDWKDNRNKTYVFEINNKEAENLVTQGLKKKSILGLLHTPVDTFNRNDYWNNAPDKGHFILANIQNNEVIYNYRVDIPFKVFLFKEYGVLTMQVIDKNGDIRSDAKVKIKNELSSLFDRRINFDRTTKTYTLDDTSDKSKRILTVELDGFKAIFDLGKKFPRDWGDGYYGGSGNQPDFYSYMITDKNKYKPGETVRFKSYALSENKRPLREELGVWIKKAPYYYYDEPEYKKISTLKSYNPGGYAGELLLHDSLDLSLDEKYSIYLTDRKGRIVANTTFEYEDYELFGNKLEVSVDKRVHYYPDTNRVTIKATDANGLILQDMKAKILISRSQVFDSYVDVFTMSDTLMYKEMSLDNDAPTVFDIPAEVLGEANSEYGIIVSTYSFDNQPLTYYDRAYFYRSSYELYAVTEADSIRFDFTELGKIKSIKAEIIYSDSTESKIVDLPYKELFNPNNVKCEVKVLDLPIPYSKAFYSSSFGSRLNIEGGISADSFNVKLINPFKLNVSWYLYQGNVLLEKGSGSEFDFKYPNTNLEVIHYVEMFYMLGGEEQVYRRVFVPKTEYLDVNIDLPDRIYPGQTVDATITVKDHMGKPMKGVDLTAFSYNSLLEYSVPDLPYYGSRPRNREERVSYNIEESDYSLRTPLDFYYWRDIAKLDSIDYYKYTYPWDKLFTHTVETPDSTTQFAPFVMEGGVSHKIYTIVCNGDPIYFSWTEQPQAYSFIVSDTMKYSVVLRLADRAITLDSMMFESGKKTILSVDLEHLPARAKVLRFPSSGSSHYQFTSTEKGKFSQYISRIPIPRKSDYVYLKQDSLVYPIYHWLSDRSDYNKPTSRLIGPFAGGMTQYMDGVKYKHTGGYSYDYEDNVVYKTPTQVYPTYLYIETDDAFDRLNQFAITDKVFKTKIKDYEEKITYWNPSNVYISQSRMVLNIILPKGRNDSGVSNLLLRNDTNKLYYPDNIEYNTRKYSYIPPGKYDIILLYNNGEYLQFDSVPFMNNAFTQIKMDKCILHEKDTISTKWLLLNAPRRNISLYRNSGSVEREYVSSTLYTRSSNAGNLVKGTVVDSNGEALIGVSILVKGTHYGTLTDVDGNFEISIDSNDDVLVFSYIGFLTKEMKVKKNSNLKITMEDNALALDDVVVVAFGIRRSEKSLGYSVTTVSSESVSTSAPEENVEETGGSKDGAENEVKAAEAKLYEELKVLSGLRSNFSDVGFWQPALFTNRKGEAKFTTTFPDNITSWYAIVYAMNSKLQTGTFRKSINSYKPLMAEIKMPRFMVVGDSSYFAGNIRNYTGDKDIKGNILFTIKQDTILNKDIVFANSHQDKMLVAPTTTDSITSTYLFTRNDGYNDGEEYTIPVELQGTEVAEGSLDFLRQGDKLSVKAAEGEQLHVKVTGNQLDVYMDAAGYLMGYKYACNEQLASKLIGILNFKIYKEYLNEKFKHDKEVKEIIKRLLTNKTHNGLWSWWGNSGTTSYWMSSHVLRALKEAKNAGYSVDLYLDKTAEDYADLNYYRTPSISDIQVLHVLSEWNSEQNYVKAIDYFDKVIASLEYHEDTLSQKYKYRIRKSYLDEKLMLMEIRQKQNIGYESDSISKYLKKDILGAIYCDDGYERYWYSDKLATTLKAYRMVRNDSTLSHFVEPMQMYILGTKDRGWNTYQSSSALSTVFPDLIASGFSRNKPATIQLRGKENKEVSSFPYETILSSGESLDIEKKDGMPLIYTSYKMKRVTEANSGEAFEISSYLNSYYDSYSYSRREADTIYAGVPTALTVEVKVKQKNAEHIMIEIPIPAGCSYASKYNWGWREVHREYFKEKVSIFSESLPEGTHYFSVYLLPRYTGRYILNPAKVEMMYFPVINANNDMRKVNVEERSN